MLHTVEVVAARDGLGDSCSDLSLVCSNSKWWFLHGSGIEEVFYVPSEGHDKAPLAMTGP